MSTEDASAITKWPPTACGVLCRQPFLEHCHKGQQHPTSAREDKQGGQGGSKPGREGEGTGEREMQEGVDLAVMAWILPVPFVSLELVQVPKRPAESETY